MIIYLVCAGEKHEGYGIVSAHESYDSARTTAIAHKLTFEDEPWNEAKVESSKDYWESGCDYVTIKKAELVK